MADTALSRRVSEFTGVVLFAGALLWLIALITYTQTDPVWFFNDVPAGPVNNFAGPVGAFGALASLQLVGYTAFLLPIFLGVVAWNRFWCRPLDAGYTKSFGAVLFVTCAAGLFALAFSALSGQDHSVAGGMIGKLAADTLSNLLNRTGAAILLLTLLSLSVIVSTHFSFGRAAAGIGRRVRAQRGLVDRWQEWRDGRRRERERQQIVDKHVKKAGRERAPKSPARPPMPPSASRPHGRVRPTTVWQTR